jgi:hypothetical protein
LEVARNFPDQNDLYVLLCFFSSVFSLFFLTRFLSFVLLFDSISQAVKENVAEASVRVKKSKELDDLTVRYEALEMMDTSDSISKSSSNERKCDTLRQLVVLTSELDRYDDCVKYANQLLASAPSDNLELLVVGLPPPVFSVCSSENVCS